MVVGTSTSLYTWGSVNCDGNGGGGGGGIVVCVCIDGGGGGGGRVEAIGGGIGAATIGGLNRDGDDCVVVGNDFGGTKSLDVDFLVVNNASLWDKVE